MPVTPQSIVTIEPRVGKQPTIVDGISVSAGANSEQHVCYTIPASLHLDELLVLWKDFESGDQGWLRLMHPSANGNPAADPSGTSVDVGALSPYYDPANGAQALEFWDSGETELLEVVPIASIAGTVVTLASTPAGTYTTANKIKARYQSFNPISGTHGLDGSFCFLGAGSVSLGAPNEQTAALPAGLDFCIGVKVGSGGATRQLAVNFIFREVEV